MVDADEGREEEGEEDGVEQGSFSSCPPPLLAVEEEDGFVMETGEDRPPVVRPLLLEVARVTETICSGLGSRTMMERRTGTCPRWR